MKIPLTRICWNMCYQTRICCSLCCHICASLSVGICVTAYSLPLQTRIYSSMCHHICASLSVKIYVFAYALPSTADQDLLEFLSLYMLFPKFWNVCHSIFPSIADQCCWSMCHCICASIRAGIYVATCPLVLLSMIC